MKGFVRGTLAAVALAMVAVTADPLAAQGRQKEIRLDFLSLQTSDGNTAIAAGFPGSVALAFYMNPNVAIEPQVGILYTSTEDAAGNDESGTILTGGLFVPFYFNNDMGRSGMFISPGLEISKGTGDSEFDARVDYGVDVGMKMTRSDRISSRLALTLRDGDSFGDPVLGAVFGIGLFWR